MKFATAGTKIYIGGQVALKDGDFAESDFAGQTWVEIGGHENLGSIGDNASEVTSRQIRSRRLIRFKGLRGPTTMELVCALDSEDTGQAALVAAEKVRANYAFRIVFPDAPDGGSPSERLFIAVVGAITEELGEGDNVAKLNASLWLNSNTVRIDAAEASP